MMRKISELTKPLMTWKGSFVSLCILATLSVKFIITYHTYLLETVSVRKNYTYVISVNECPVDANIYMLILVGSHPDHGEIRDAIRQTWGNPRLKNYTIKLVFTFGKVRSISQQKQLEAEHHKYGDILEGKFMDSYHNVTIRDLMGFEWASQHCQQAKYILRADDDIALDIYKMIRNIDAHYSNVDHFIGCFAIIKNAIPQRTGRYAVSIEDYPHQFYADYCDGWAYVLTPVVAHQLVLKAFQRKPMWINDVYITGTLIESLALSHELLYLSYTYSYADMILFAKNYNGSTKEEIAYDLGPIQQNCTLLSQIQTIYKTRAIRDGFLFESD